MAIGLHSHTSRSRRRMRHYRQPYRFEPLESRWLLACQVFLDQDGTLFIVGDEADNRIAITASERGVEVTCDGDAHSFGPVVAIDVRADGGNDVVTERLAGGPTRVSIDLGDGIDSVIAAFESQNGQSAAIGTHKIGHAQGLVHADDFGDPSGGIHQPPSGWGLRVHFGGVIDTLFVTGTAFADQFDIARGTEAGAGEIKFSDIASKKLRAQISTVGIESLSVQSGAGMDSLSVNSSPFAELTLDGGEGVDALQFIGRSDGDEYDIRPGAKTGFGIEVQDSAAQTTAISLDVTNVESTKVETGDGDDDINVTFPLPTDFYLRAGDGLDFLQLRYTMFQEDGTTLRPVENFAFKEAADMGDGKDRVSMQGTDEPESFEVMGVPDATVPDPRIRITDLTTKLVTFDGLIVGAEAIDIHTAGGKDQFTMSDADGSLGGIDFKVDTGDDDDTVNVEINTGLRPPSDNPGAAVSSIGTSDRKDPLTTFLFGLKLGAGNDTAFFKSVGGLKYETEVVDYQAGGGNDKIDFQVKSPRDPASLTYEIGPGAGDDEVLVAFEHGDIRHPYVLGALWNDRDAPPQGDDQAGGNLSLDILADSQLFVNLGLVGTAGSDTVDVNIVGACQEQKLDISTGDANDAVAVRLPNPPPGDPEAAIADINVNVGAGFDSVMLDVFGSRQQPLPSDLSDISEQVALQEILASIFISGIGQLALLTLFPLGSLEMAQAINDDREGNIATDVSLLLDGVDFTAIVNTGATDDSILIGLTPRAESQVVTQINTGDGNDRLHEKLTVVDPVAANAGGMSIENSYALGLGNDAIAVESALVPGKQSYVIDGGDGDNTASLTFGDGQTGQIPPTGGTIRATYRSGQGDDHISVNVAAVQIGDPNLIPRPPFAFSLDIAPGAGDDEVLVAFEHGDIRHPYVLGALWNDHESPPQGGDQAVGKLSLDILADNQLFVDFGLVGTAGNDTVDVNIAGACQEQKLDISTGDASDAVAVRVVNPAPGQGGEDPEAPDTVRRRAPTSINTGNGDDKVKFEETGVLLADGGEANWSFLGGMGADEFDLRVANAQAGAQAQWTWTTDTGEGDDLLKVHLFEIDLGVGSLTDWSFLTGEGSDNIDFVRCFMDIGAGSTYGWRLGSGGGDDTLAVMILDVTFGDGAKAAYAWDTGAGNDKLDADISGLIFPTGSRFDWSIVDGGGDNTLNLALRNSAVVAGAHLNLDTTLAGSNNDFTAVWDHVTNAGTIDWDIIAPSGRTRFKPLFAFYVEELDGKLNFNQNFSQGSAETEFVMHDSIIAGDWHWNYQGGAARHRMFAIIDRTQMRSNVFAVWTTVGFFQVQAEVEDVSISGMMDMKVQGGSPESTLQLDLERVDVPGAFRWRSDPYAETALRAVNWLVSGTADLHFGGTEVADRYRLELDDFQVLPGGSAVIDIDARGGDDVVEAVVYGRYDGELRADLGEGDDGFTLNAPQGWQAAAIPGNPCNIVEAGGGNDSVAFRFGGPLSANLEIDVSLGDGNNSFLLDANQGWQAAAIPSNPCIVVESGGGNDSVVFRFGGPISANLEIDVSLGEGDNSLLLDAQQGWQAAAIPSNPCIVVESGGGSDSATLRFGGPVTANLEIDVSLGDGNNSFLLDSQAGWSAKPDPQNPLLAPLIKVVGGAQRDTIIARMGQVSGNLQVALDGREGNDIVAADLMFAQLGLGMIDVALSGGVGNDLLTLLALGRSNPQRTRLMIDGGAGFDIAIGTANVDAFNCEVVIGARRRR